MGATHEPLDEEAQAPRGPDLHWPDVRAWLQARPDHLTEDRALLEELGLRPTGRNVVDFGRAALTRLSAAAEREAGARKQIEAVARANFVAQTQTHAAVMDLLEARNHSDLARRLDAAAKGRFGLVGAAIALETPGGVPFGFKTLAEGRVDDLLGDHGLTWLGPAFPDLGLFTAAEVKSVALIRMAPQLPGAAGPGRPALAAFAASDPEGFTPDMGCELVAFITRAVERMVERWPILT